MFQDRAERLDGFTNYEGETNMQSPAPEHVIESARDDANRYRLAQTVWNSDDQDAPWGHEAAGGTGSSVTHRPRWPVVTVLPSRYYVVNNELVTT